jgi:hypothetical protein
MRYASARTLCAFSIIYAAARAHYSLSKEFCQFKKLAKNIYCELFVECKDGLTRGAFALFAA